MVRASCLINLHSCLSQQNGSSHIDRPQPLVLCLFLSRCSPPRAEPSASAAEPRRHGLRPRLHSRRAGFYSRTTSGSRTNWSLSTRSRTAHRWVALQRAPLLQRQWHAVSARTRCGGPAELLAGVRTSAPNRPEAAARPPLPEVQWRCDRPWAHHMLHTDISVAKRHVVIVELETGPH